MCSIYMVQYTNDRPVLLTYLSKTGLIVRSLSQWGRGCDVSWSPWYHHHHHYFLYGYMLCIYLRNKISHNIDASYNYFVSSALSRGFLNYQIRGFVYVYRKTIKQKLFTLKSPWFNFSIWYPLTKQKISSISQYLLNTICTVNAQTNTAIKPFTFKAVSVLNFWTVLHF